MEKLLKCGTCQNIVETKGQLTVYSQYHGGNSFRSFDYCRNKGCLKLAKENRNEYRKELANDIGIG